MRPSLDEYLMGLARVAASRSTCVRRSVGCVLSDRRGRVLSIGYNGVASGQPHCNESELRGADGAPGRMVRFFPHACRDSDLAPGLDGCEAVHAEQNAMLQCRDPDAVWAAHVTLSPCKACLKLLLGTPCQAIVFDKPHEDQAPGGLWVRAGRSWHHLPRPPEAPPGQNPDPLARPDGPGGRF